MSLGILISWHSCSEVTTNLPCDQTQPSGTDILSRNGFLQPRFCKVPFLIEKNFTSGNWCSYYSLNGVKWSHGDSTWKKDGSFKLLPMILLQSHCVNYTVFGLWWRTHSIKSERFFFFYTDILVPEAFPQTEITQNLTDLGSFPFLKMAAWPFHILPVGLYGLWLNDF